MSKISHDSHKTRRVIRCLDSEQQATLWNFLSGSHRIDPQDGRLCRDTCVILLMLDAGLRVSEVSSLRRSDLLFGEGPVVDLIVRAAIAKNGVERIVPLSDRLREAIQNTTTVMWLQQEPQPDHYAFWTNNPTRPITTRQIQRIVKQICGYCLGIHVTPHMLRHTFATKMMHLTDIRTVQTLLGHASLISTQIYTHPSLSDLRKAIGQTNGDSVTPPC